MFSKLLSKRFPAAWICGLLALLCSGVWAAEEPRNLLRNGSFEGGLRYWHDLIDRELTLVQGQAAHGEYSLRIGKRYIQSAAFELQQGRTVTVSFFAKAEGGPTTIGIQCSPCGREIGVRNNLTWGMKQHNPIKITTEWKRYTWTYTPKVPQDGFWTRPTHMIQIGDADKPWHLDGLCVAYEGGGEAYIPWRPVEVQLHCPELKGYRDPSANVLEKGQTVTLDGTAFNAGAAERTLTLRFSFADYERTRIWGAPQERQLTVPAGKTGRISVQVALPATGLLLGRVEALDGGTVIDSSEIPLCSLPYPKAATKADMRERFGGSLRGPHTSLQAQRIGFAWSRWYPHMNWADHQKSGPDAWHDFGPVIDTLNRQGIAVNAVLFGWPDWAFAKDNRQLPKDMNWPADDPRWEDLSVETHWDRFVKRAVASYKGKALIYEIENEPELDGWDKKTGQYVKFTIRTARLIKQTDPAAKVMIDNVYAIPSGLNQKFFEQGGGKYIDIISWHDYHEGWLADATSMRRMKERLKDYGAGHVEIWFNEGWCYTNTAVDEPAVALTNLDAAQSTHALVCSIAELTANGQEKTILFHTGYETHGMSFWDYAGPGTQLWDWYGYPLPLVPAWNTLAHHVGLSEVTGFVRPDGANVCIFQDLRNNRGVMVAYADRKAKADVTLELPLAGLKAEDCMGNPVELAGGRTLVLQKSGRPVFLYAPENTPGKTFLEKMEPLDRRHLGFVAAGETPEYRLPRTWEGTEKGSAAGNPVRQGGAGGTPVWRIDQVWPENPIMTAHYRPMIWNGTDWVAASNGAGGQPRAGVQDGAFSAEVRGSWGGAEGQRICGLVFIAPRSGVYRITGNARTRPWTGNAKTFPLGIFKKDTQRSALQKSFDLPRTGEAVPLDFTVELSEGHELVFLPQVPVWHSATATRVEDLVIREAKP